MIKLRPTMLFGVPVVFFLAWAYPYIPGHDLNICAVRLATGISCPGCGFVRSIVALVHGEFKRSINFNPMGIVAAIIMIYLWLKLFFLGVVLRRDSVLMNPAAARIVSVVFVAGLFIQWFFYLGILASLK